MECNVSCIIRKIDVLFECDLSTHFGFSVFTTRDGMRLGDAIEGDATRYYLKFLQLPEVRTELYLISCLLDLSVVYSHIVRVVTVVCHDFGRSCVSMMAVSSESQHTVLYRP